MHKLVQENAYIGQSGYTVKKSVLSQTEISQLKKDLTMQAMSNGKPSGEAFQIYKENEKKLYLPKFYGLERFGVPSVVETQNGTDISTGFPKFVANLRDYQTDIVSKYVSHIGENMGGGIIVLPCGFGKTVIALNIISLLKKKTLIVVHTSSLLTQWIERILEYIPEARVGRMQGPIYDTEDKDIVIGMVQTLYNRDYPKGTFEQFGVLVVDEVHRIASMEFSKTLMRVGNPITLGITATLERKDGLTPVLYAFLGSVAFSKTERGDEDIVTVRPVTFRSTDVEYNKVELDMYGKVKYSTMISKICNFQPRSEFIVTILQKLIKENPQKQIMVLAHNICLLKYIYKRLGELKFATFGYYIGSIKKTQHPKDHDTNDVITDSTVMEIDDKKQKTTKRKKTLSKDEMLKETESKQIILGSYAMCSTGLDIKTLSTMVFVTPKTDVIQCVGRILRIKGNMPLLIDIIDTHSTFMGQWRKRKAYYKSCKYPIDMDFYGSSKDVVEDTDDANIEDTNNGICDVLLSDEEDPTDNLSDFDDT